MYANLSECPIRGVTNRKYHRKRLRKSDTKQIKIISDKGFYSSETFPALHEQNMNRPKWRNAVPYKRNNEPYSGFPLFRDGNTIGCQTGNRGNQVRVVNELCRGEAFILKIKKR